MLPDIKQVILANMNVKLYTTAASFTFRKVVWEHNWGEVLISPYFQFISAFNSEKIVKIGLHLPKCSTFLDTGYMFIGIISTIEFTGFRW